MALMLSGKLSDGLEYSRVCSSCHFYSVIAGWALDYIFLISSGDLQGVNGAAASAKFSELLSDPSRLIMWQSVFMVLCVAVVVGGVKKGLWNRR